MTCRWLPYSEGDAAWNMAVDEAILEAHLQGQSPPTLRFYGWSPSAVSLGYAQRLDERVIASIRSRGFEVVRRPTGGRAVLHHGDLTYAFISSSSSPIDAAETNFRPSPADAEKYTLFSLPTSVSASYLQICSGLVEGLKMLNVEAEIGRGKGAYNRFQDCFQATTTADLQVNGLKIIGSAQLRRSHAVLQHGSILLNQSQNLMTDLLLAKDSQGLNVSVIESPDMVQAATPLRHCNLFDITGQLAVEQVERAFVKGFSLIAKQNLSPGQLTELEINLAKKFVTRYQVAANQQPV